MYLLLYLVPDKLISENATLRAQKQYLRSYFEETVVPMLLGTGNFGEVPLFERVLSGLINLENECPRDALEEIAPKWYVFMKRTYASIGPRIGNFTESLIGLWIGANHINYNLDRFLEEHFGVKIKKKKRSQIDFVRIRSHTLDLIELRTSEHTGGRTGQESLTDKFVRFLGLLEDSNVKLRNALLNKGIKNVNLLVVTLFNESGELLTPNNLNKGRYASLVGYLSEERHLGGKIKELLSKGYILHAGERQFTEPPDDIEVILKNAFLEKRRVLLEKDDFIVEIGILWGDEFFHRFTGKGLEELLRNDIKDRVGDDLWMFLVLTLNELRLRASEGKSTIDMLRDYLLRCGEFETLIELRKKANSLDEFLDDLGNLVDSIIPGFLRELGKNGRKLRLLGTDDLVAQYNYLRGVVLLTLALEFYLRKT
ncbi:hypothetical protein [Thermococcus sp.]|uniref:hypothetical protein n=1 Tax=Thermococcus sp. TaxID=35749 RepID=UPI00260FD81E|nr:hypothetical protein [Thermococcus sp.]